MLSLWREREKEQIGSGRVIRDAVAHLVVDKVVDFFKGPAVEVTGEGLELVGQYGAVLDADLTPRLKSVLAHQLHRLVFEALERLPRERLHLLLGQLGGGARRVRKTAQRAAVRRHRRVTARGAQIGLGGAAEELPRGRRRRRRRRRRRPRRLHAAGGARAERRTHQRHCTISLARARTAL